MDKIVVCYEKNRLTTKYYRSYADSSYSNIFFGKEAQKFIDEIETREAADAKITKDGKVIRIVFPDRVIFVKDYKKVFEYVDARKRVEKYNFNKAKRYMKGSRKAKRVSKTGPITKGLMVLLIMVSVLTIGHQIKTHGEPLTSNVSATWINENQESVEQYLNEAHPEVEENDQGYDNLLANTQILSLMDIEEAENKKEPTNGELLAKMVKEKDTIYQNFNIDFSDRTSDEKAINAKNNYYDIISRYAKTYGIDPNLMMAIATQEKGIHSNVMDAGGGVGLMQMQYGVWVNQDISAYNFETNKWETFHITDNNIRELDTNIKIGCMYFQNCLNNMQYNVPAALCAYNWGATSTQNKLEKFSKDRGLTTDETLNASDTSWINLFAVDGDVSLAYPKMVLSYYDTSIPIKNEKLDKDGNQIVVSTTLENQKKLNIN